MSVAQFVALAHRRNNGSEIRAYIPNISLILTIKIFHPLQLNVFFSSFFRYQKFHIDVTDLGKHIAFLFNG